MNWLKRLLGIGYKLNPVRSASLMSAQLVELPPLTTTRDAGKDDMDTAPDMADIRQQAMHEAEAAKQQMNTPAPTSVKGRITISDGQSYVLEGTCLVGRMPSQTAQYAHTLVINDPTGQVSREHFACGMDNFGRVWVEDLGSANGTWIRTPLGDKRLAPHTREVVAQGALIVFSTFSAGIDYVDAR